MNDSGLAAPLLEAGLKLKDSIAASLGDIRVVGIIVTWKSDGFMVSFSFTKKIPPKEVVLEIDDDAPRIRQITSITALGSVPLIPELTPPPITELVIPCANRGQTTKTELTGPKSSQVTVKSGVGGFVYLPEHPIGQKRKGTSLLMSIKAAREKGEVRDAPDQPQRGFEADEFAWGVLRGMGYDAAKDKAPTPAESVQSNRERFGIGSNLKK